MTNWKNLRINPPTENCNICLKIGTNYETFFFKTYSKDSWELIKDARPFGCHRIPAEAMYINLNEIL